MFYDYPTWPIVLGLLVIMLMANEIGFRIGLRDRKKQSEQGQNVSGALKASIFALVALLLAFSFSATTSRHELRQRLVLDQANAIGTCYLRAGLLPEEQKSRIQEILKQYVEKRLAIFAQGRQPGKYQQLSAEIDQLLSQLWVSVEYANVVSPETTRNSMIVPAANDVIDLSSTRAWAVRNHLPRPILQLLLACIVLSSLLYGHSSGQSGVRHLGLWLSANIVFALVLYVVLDFDRPRQGLIQVDHTPLVEFAHSIGVSLDKS